MQTFLPYANFGASVECLDYRRLGKQRVECKQLLKALEVGGSWANHPAAKMWRGYELALAHYMNYCILEWMGRGFKNNMYLVEILEDPHLIEMPPWLGSEEFHASHRSNLLRKDPVYYSQFNWVENPNIPYKWPV